MQLRQLRQLRQLVQILQILQCVQGTYCGGWRRCVCLDAKTRVLAVGALARATCNNFIADLLFLSEVPHSLLVAGPPCVHPYLGEWALLRSAPPIARKKNSPPAGGAPSTTPSTTPSTAPKSPKKERFPNSVQVGSPLFRGLSLA